MIDDLTEYFRNDGFRQLISPMPTNMGTLKVTRDSFNPPKDYEFDDPTDIPDMILLDSYRVKRLGEKDMTGFVFAALNMYWGGMEDVTRDENVMMIGRDTRRGPAQINIQDAQMFFKNGKRHDFLDNTVWAIQIKQVVFLWAPPGGGGHYYREDGPFRVAVHDVKYSFQNGIAQHVQIGKVETEWDKYTSLEVAKALQFLNINTSPLWREYFRSEEDQFLLMSQLG